MAGQVCSGCKNTLHLQAQTLSDGFSPLLKTHISQLQPFSSILMSPRCSTPFIRTCSIEKTTAPAKVRIEAHDHKLAHISSKPRSTPLISHLT